MKNLLRCCVLCVLVFSVLNLYAQSRTIRGTVSDRETGAPLIGVSVTVTGTTTGIVTDENGNYTLSVPKDAKSLTFQYIGYVAEVIAVTAESQLVNTAMSADSKALDEIVVVGYGTQKASSVTSAISKVGGEDLNDRPATRIDNAMAGKLAGVQVQEISGAPGKGLTVKVRGSSSINYASTPLYVVDGFPLSSGLDNINPNDIESIEVLKDAASAAIYGSRGANGVVLVTTKSGKSGTPTFQFDTYVGFQKRLSKYDVLNRDEYIDFAIEERNNTWELQGGNASDPNEERSNAAFWIDPAWSNSEALPDNDWQKLIEQSAPIQNYQLSASGANDKLKYYISGNFYDQKGVIIGSDYQRYSFLTNAETKIGNRFTFGVNLSANAVNRNDGDSDGDGGPVSRSQYMLPLFDLNTQTEEFGYNPYYAAFIVNPVALASELTNETNSKNIRANAYTEISFLDNLKLRSTFGVDYLNSVNQFFKPNNINRGSGAQGSTSTISQDNYLTEHILSYNLAKDDWTLDAIGGFSYQYDKAFNSNLGKLGFPDDDITTLNAGNVLNSGGSSVSEWNLMSFIGRANFARKEKQFLSMSLRRDGSSRFGADNQWGWFPAVSLGWLLSEEEFLRSSSTISNLKIRGSYGVTGSNNISNYASISTLSNADYTLGVGGNQNTLIGYVPSSFSNRTLGWEKTYTVNLGLDLGLIRNRVNIGFDVYQADTKDLLLNVPIPSVVGFSTSLRNIGQVRNTGVELELNTNNLVGEFKWSSGFNISHNKNEVVKLGPSGAPIYGSSVISNITITKIGEPIGSYFLFIQDGIFETQEEFDNSPHYKTQSVGDIKYKDINNDGVIDEDDRTLAGHNSPKFFWGFHNNFSYKNFDLYVSMDGQWGNKLLTVSGSSDGQSRANDEGYWRDRWRSPEQPGNGKIPRAAITPNMTTPSTFWLRDASYFRIRTVALGYNVPMKFVERTNAFKSIRISANADNVFLHDHNNGNPQTAVKSNSNAVPGIDYGASYPLARTFTLNISARF
ncbi:SusC/RagA family TonB-linked outer membrane protein [Albibacterium indicum]|uniref:SusC/RagA family TonB-linked outer membrane protein n=1 Tax=Albibacterium indicum TaxID=2292082 RepID=UPI000E4D37A0|nr:TonB-dependent receptor [Pedobacter indicus]